MSDRGATEIEMSHADAWLSLPWFVTGALDEAERRGVEAHLATCAECRAELALQRRLADAVCADDADSQAERESWRRLERQLDAGAPPGEATAPPAPVRAGRRGQRRIGPRGGVVGGLLAASLALGLLVPLVPSEEGEAPSFQTLTDAPTVAGSLIRVRLAPDMTEAGLREAAAEHGLSVSGGSAETRVYTLTGPAEAVTRDAATALMARPGVLLATYRGGE